MDLSGVKLRVEELKKATGGNWNLYSLNEEEAREYQCLWSYYLSTMGSSKEDMAHQAVLDFEQRMNAKYGTADWFVGA